jgi:VIT1/CCC1 family predicted Fe2+/Mn2+ transporter
VPPGDDAAEVVRAGPPQLWTQSQSRESTGEIDAGGHHSCCKARTALVGPTTGGVRMIILGVILLVLGFLLGVSILWTLGIILLVVGVVLWILGATGRAVGGRKHWY